ncbi:DUF1707 domain-containing protein [Streptomyces sp. ODS28]|uniref:DUF1707 SHOCT-like domain-containing protein n=1 Tax=Streptomyces sp. ODS28 TaxID=3136688 RepID=UPI0031EC7E82
MEEPKSSGLLVGYEEKEKAFEGLAVHLRVGRLTVEEYEGRAERLDAARTRGEVRALFTDLPEPGPEFEGEEKGRGEVAVPEKGQGEVAEGGTRGPLSRAAVPLGGVAAVGLSWATGNWFFMFVTPPVFYAIEHALRGRGRKGGR